MMNYQEASDRELLVDMHGMLERLDERTHDMPEQIEELQKASATHEQNLKLLNRGFFGGMAALMLGGFGAIAKFVVGG